MSREEILDTVKQFPELWMPSHQFYKWKVKQSKAWEQIARKLNMEEKELKTRWKYLKDQYRKELKRVMGKEIKESKWHYYDKMNFLTEELLSEKKRKSSRNDRGEEDQEPPKKLAVCIEPSSSSSQDPLHEIGNTLNEIKEEIEYSNESTDSQKNDADYMFLMSILPTLRDLSDVQKFVFRGKVNEWLLEAITQNEYYKQI